MLLYQKLSSVFFAYSSSWPSTASKHSPEHLLPMLTRNSYPVQDTIKPILMAQKKYLLCCILALKEHRLPNLRLFEPILSAEGEVIRQLWSSKKRLREDFEWLNSIGYKRIQSRFQELERSGEKNIQPDQRAANVLKRSSYVVGAQLASKNMTERIELYLTHTVQADLKVHGAAPSATDNPFFWSLHLLMSGQKWLTNDQKSKSARQLLYAYRHGVPPELLTGFLLQTGTSNVVARSSDPEHLEAWYDASRTNDWISRLKKPS